MNKSSIGELEETNNKLIASNKSRFKKLTINIKNKNDYEIKYEDLVNKNAAINKKCDTISNEIEKIKAETNAIKEKLLEKHNEFSIMKAKRNVLQTEYEAVKTERDKALSELIAIESKALAEDSYNSTKAKHRKCNIV